MIAVVPLFPDLDGLLARTPQLLGRARAMREMIDAAPGPGGGLRHREPRRARRSTCTPRSASIDDIWATIGSDNFNRRSWTHDSELSAVVVDPSADGPQPLRPHGCG